MLPEEDEVDLEDEEEEEEEEEEPTDEVPLLLELDAVPGFELKEPVELLVFGLTVEPSTGLFSKVPAL